jgi:hypothetical protein
MTHTKDLNRSINNIVDVLFIGVTECIDMQPLQVLSPASSTTKTGRHDIAEILLKVVLNNKNQINQSIL